VTKIASEKKQFANFMKKGEVAWNNSNYVEALKAFESGYNLKNDQTARKRYKNAMDKVSEISRTKDTAPVASSENVDESTTYSSSIARADKEFGLSEWTIARFYYFEALKHDPKAVYAKGRIEECDQLISANVTGELQKRYQVFIANGDRNMVRGQFSNARINYTKALAIKSWEKYPTEKIEEIEKLMKGWSSEKERKQYMQAIESADNAFENKSYAVARFFYRKAQNINNDSYPEEMLVEIENILVTAQKKEKDAKYNENIQKADKAYNGNNLSVARFYYQKAIQVKPEESYPREQLQRME
jgi:hypothetical protein